MSDNHLVKRVEEHAYALSVTPLVDLRALPKISDETVQNTCGDILITVWRDDLDDGCIQVVVQGVCPADSMRRMVYAKGFKIVPDGSVVDLTELELSEFR